MLVLDFCSPVLFVLIYLTVYSIYVLYSLFLALFSLALSMISFVRSPCLRIYSTILSLSFSYGSVYIVLFSHTQLTTSFLAILSTQLTFISLIWNHIMNLITCYFFSVRTVHISICFQEVLPDLCVNATFFDTYFLCSYYPVLHIMIDVIFHFYHTTW